jgi:hypothetical protein
MAKRFTDSEKYKDPWFRKLTPKLKMLFIFMCDDCNHAGIWKENFAIFEFLFNQKVDDSDIDGFGGKVIRINQETYYIKGFVKFQYGTLYENNSAHLGVIKQLIAYNLDSLEQIQERPDPSLRTRLSTKARMKIFEKSNFTCEYCGKKLHPEALVIDHIKSLAKGGTNTDDNLAGSCATCNSYKSDLELNEFISRHSESLMPSKRILELLNGAFSDVKWGTGLGIGSGKGSGIGNGKGNRSFTNTDIPF